MTARRRHAVDTDPRFSIPVLVVCASLWFALATQVLAGSPASQPLPPSLLGIGEAPAVGRVVMPAVDAAELLAEDAAVLSSGRPVRPRFAVAIEQRLHTENSGRWSTLADGSELWRLRITSFDARNLNLGFTTFELPPGGALWIHDPTGAQVHGPYTRRDRNAAGGLWTPIVEGDEIEIELVVPAGARDHTRLVLGSINHGYRELGHLPEAPDTKQGLCNIDVICPEGDPWRPQIRSVARISILGAYLCTAQLVNTTAEDDRPYLLTAQHCVENAGQATTVVTYWNYESPQCGLLAGGRLSQNQSGATLLASWPWRSGSDFALIELDDAPDPDFDVYFAGWDASGATPQGVVGIHHPKGDEKAISFDEDPLTRVDYYGSGDHQWRVGQWERGTTEPGSSGSCIFDATSGLCVGTLTTGSASCENPEGYDIYGRFDVHWTGGGTPNSRLSDWLDPEDTGALTVEGKEPNGGGGGISRLWLIPAAASTPGAEGSDWQTELSVVNPTTQSMTIHVNYVATGISWPGIPLLNEPAQVPAGAALVLDDPLRPLRPTSGMLYVVVDGDGAAVSSRTYNRTSDGATFGQGIPGVPVVATEAADELILPLVHNSAGQFRTNVGFVQTSAGELTVHISAFSADGTLLGEGTFSSSSGFRQINNIFSELGIGSQVVEGGWLRVRLTGPAPSHWTCYASVIDSRTNDPTYVLPVEP